MALSVIVIPGDGVTTQFSIPFALGYIKESDITARVGNEQDGAGNPIYRTLTFLSPTSVVVSGAPAPSGTNIVFTRTVDRDQLIVDYEDGDIINEENMNTAQKQAIMLVHEVLDGRFSQFQSDVDMGGFRITGIGAPTNPGDGANKAYVDGLISTGAANAAIAVAARDAAIAARNTAQASQAAAASSESNAAASAASAQANANSTNADKIATAADRVQTGLDRAQTGSDRTATAADRVATAADRAQTGLDKSATAADRVQTGSDRTAAATSATQANTAQNFAWEWSSKAVDAQVNDGTRTGYSSYHWAVQAAASAAAAAQSAEDAAIFDPSSYYTKTETDAKYLTLSSAQADFYTKTQIDTTFGGYYTKSAVDTAVGGRVAKTGDTMSGDLAIYKVYPTVRLNYAGIRIWDLQPREDGNFHIWDVSGGGRRFTVQTDGGVWTAQLGDLNTRIETRARDYANDRVANLNSRWVSRGQLNMGNNVWVEAPSGAALTGWYNHTSQQFSFFYYRYFQLFDPVRGWITAHNA